MQQISNGSQPVPTKYVTARSDAAYSGQQKSSPSERHTFEHFECPACDELRKMYVCSFSATLTFSEAAEIYMRMRAIGTASSAGKSARKFLRHNTVVSYEQYIRSLSLFFGPMQIGAIHEGNVAEYQMARRDGRAPFIRRRRPHEKPRPLPCKPKQIDKEICLLKMILVRAGCWTEEMRRNVGNVPDDEDDDLVRALSPEDQAHWLDVARSKERWNVVYWYSIVAFATTCSTNELRALRIGDVNLQHRTISIPRSGAKNRYRQRTIPIEDGETLWALERLLGRAQDLGSSSPLHHLFPFRPNAKGAFDPTRPMTSSGLKRLWQEVREESGLLTFRMYDTRHTGITRMAENGVPLAVIMARAGHIGERMTQHYTQVSDSAQRHAMRRPALEPCLRKPVQSAMYVMPTAPRAVETRTVTERPGYKTIYVEGIAISVPA